ncbi:MAG: hypothetical protein QNJ70_27280 [Xenococcaceae cyanobacterium MO_207.B15]|nr:hypothetical protein [Xenococcaceae cyanobacterium MO_207.B15]
MSSVLAFATPDIISSANGDFGLDVVGDQDGQNTIWIGDSNGPINDGGSGADDLFGGEGADTFKFDLEDFGSGEIDTVRDFEVGVDEIIISGIDPELVDLEGNTFKYDGDTIINLRGDVTGIQGESPEDDIFKLF